MARKTIGTSKRAAIWRAHERRCIYCTEMLAFADLDVDHIVPIRLKDQPKELAKLIDEYELKIDFDIDSLLNLVPAHRHCNLQKKGQILPKNRALHFLSIAEQKNEKACVIEIELKEQAQKDKIIVNLQVALDQGKISREDLSAIIAGYAKSQNMFEVLTNLHFVDSELKGQISSTDVDLLYDRQILPRKPGLDKLIMVKSTLSVEKIIAVRTCREWAEAVRDGYYPSTNYDIKEEIFFKQIYALVVALAHAKSSKYRYISDQKVSIVNFDLLPVALLPALSREDVDELQCYESDGIGIPDLIDQGSVKIISSSPLSLTLYYNHMGLYLNEILRADLNEDGIEDMLISSYEWTLEGTHGVGQAKVLTRLAIDQPFTISKGIVLDVRQ